MRRSFLKNLIVFIVALLAAGTLYYFHAMRSSRMKEYPTLPCQSVKTASNQPEKLFLPDGSHIVLYPNAQLKISCDFGKGNRQVLLDGEAYFQISGESSFPFNVISKDLSVYLKAGSFHFLASSKDAGEQFELLRGNATVGKTYLSQDSVKETLRAGDMVMINRSIDLMEKESFDTVSLSGNIRRLFQ